MIADPTNGTDDSAVVLLSGGLDSATALAIARDRGHECHAITFRYGQKHEIEVEFAERTARNQGVSDHRIIDLPFHKLATSALTQGSGPVPHDRPPEELTDNIPPTYVPARNTIFLSCALARAESTDSDFIFCGVNAVDYSGYPDCRPGYITEFQQLANLATRKAVEGTPTQICAPLQGMNKAGIIRRGMELGVDYSLTLSCYDPDDRGRACGHCDACRFRQKGFQEAGLADPAPYQS
ncbi:MAG: 7-cyano-7-deazaguanine synthase QueC [Planctomycetota bacterium]